MAVTEDDTLREVILKNMIGEAWAAGELTAEDRTIIEDWIGILALEGPERERLVDLLSRQIDSFQAEIFHNELKAVLVRATNIAKAREILRKMLEGRSRVHPLEERLREAVERILGDKSQLERMIENCADEPAKS